MAEPTAREKIRASLIETFVETGCRDADAQRYADETIAEISAMALAEAADALQLHIDAKWSGPDREGQRRLWLYPLVDLVRRLAMPH